jgi:hypothetical protein
MRNKQSLHFARPSIILCLGLVICCLVSAQKPNDKKAKPALPVSVLGLSGNVLNIQWEELQAGRAGFSLANNSPDSKAKDIKIDITPLSLPGSQTIPLSVDRNNLVSLQRFKSERFQLTIPDQQKFKLQPGTYNSLITIQDQGEKFVAVNVSILVTIPSIQPSITKGTLVATEFIPFSGSFRGTLIVPLRFPSAASELPKVELRQSIVRRDSGGLATVNWSELQQKHRASCCAELTVNSLPSAGRYEGEINFGSGQDKNSMLSITVIGTDCVIWPILVILFGIWLAYKVNRYVGVLRLTWTLRRQEAQLEQSYRESQAKFLSATRGTVSASYDISNDLRQRRKDLRTLLATLESKWTTSLQGDTDYSNTVTYLQTLETGIALWAQFGPALAALKDPLDKARSEIDPDSVLPRRVREPQLFSLAQELLCGSVLSIDDLSAKLQAVRDNRMLLERWRNINQQAKDAISSLQDFRNQKLDTNQSSIADQIEQHLTAAWQLLWDADDLDTLTSITSGGADLPAARIKIAQLAEQLQRPVSGTFSLVADVAQIPVSLIESVVVSTVVSELLQTGENRAQYLHEAINRADKYATLFAFGIALLTGLSLKYFGQPFGTLQDYVGLFLWAAGTKATLDILTSVIAKFSSAS